MTIIYLSSIKYLYISFAIIGLFALIYAFILIDRKKQKEKIIKKLKTYGELTKSDNKIYDYSLEYNSKNIKLKIVHVGNTKEVSINSQRHWQIHGGKGINLINTQGFEYLDAKKFLIIYPKPERVLKYINENEVVFVKRIEKCFDFYLLTPDDLDSLEEVLNII